MNPDTFENGVSVLKRSLSTLAFSSIFQKFLIHTETSENVKLAVLHMRKTSKKLTETEQTWSVLMQFFWQGSFYLGK